MKAIFPRSYKIKSNKTIKDIYDRGNKIFQFPFLVYYLPSEDLSHPKYAITVPKKKFRKAVDRNRIRRLITETIRLYHPLIEKPELYHTQFLVIYVGEAELPLTTLKKKYIQLMKKYELMSIQEN